jgi:hypothetical protein
MKALTAAVVSMAALLIACGGSSPASATPAATPTAMSSSPAKAGHGTCPDLKPGTAGVITSFCDGTAVVNVSVGGVSKTLRGGTCTTSAGLFVVNAGIATTHEFVGTRPDQVSVNAPPEGGSGQNTGASVVLDGKFYGDSGRFGGTVTFANGGKSLHFDGSAFNGDKAIIDVTC